jgi:drug/metabolite transporter (DMT)-like permease
MEKAFVQLHIAVFLAGFTAVLGRLISLNEGLLVWYRLLITIIVMAIILWVEKAFVKISTKSLLQMVGVGAVIAFHWVTFYGSIKYGNISVALVCLSSAGFFSSLLEPLFLRKKIIFAEVLLGLLAIVGIYIIFDFHPQFKVGILYGILGALGAAIFPIFNKQLLQKHSPRMLTLVELTGGFLVLSIVLPFYLKSANVSFSVPNFSDVVWLLILAIVCTVICFDLQLKALQKISAFTCNLMYNLEPLYGIILAFIFFGEGKMLNSAFYVGAVLIFNTITLQMVRLKYSKQKANSPT